MKGTQSVLLLDLGNSRIKWARVRDGRLEAVRSAPREAGLARFWTQVSRPGGKAPARVVAVSVLDAATNRALAQAAAGRWGVTVEFCSAHAEGWGVRNAYPLPWRLGADRWAALVAVRHRWPGEAVAVIDCGTAVTLDVLDEAGRHRGGLILPGLEMMRSALAGGTVALADLAAEEAGREGRAVADAAPAFRLADSTATAVEEGCFQALVGSVERLARLARGVLGSTPRLVLSGGAGAAVLPWLDGTFQYRPDLVLEGALVMAETVPHEDPADRSSEASGEHRGKSGGETS